MPVQLLSDRGALRLRGADVVPFLQDLVTNDVETLAAGQSCFAALLTPQGKILFDFFICRWPDSRADIILDVPLDRLRDLAQRLALYRLRAKVEVEDASDELRIAAAWGGVRPEGANSARWFVDPRSEHAGLRGFLAAGEDVSGAGPGDYEAHRIVRALPKGGLDFHYGDAFPHEVNMDRLNGLSFHKGCYVGQEVVSRMQHRGTVRNRVTPVAYVGDPPPAGAEIRAGDLLLGRMGSARDGLGLAMLRLDRLEESVGAAAAMLCAGVEVRLR